MVVVKVELWPGGDSRRAKVLGVAEIANDGRGTATVGNYVVRLLKFGGRGTWRAGRVEGFPRLRLGPWDLLFRALAACVGDRNRGAARPGDGDGPIGETPMVDVEADDQPAQVTIPT